MALRPTPRHTILRPVPYRQHNSGANTYVDLKCYETLEEEEDLQDELHVAAASVSPVTPLSADAAMQLFTELSEADTDLPSYTPIF